MTVPIDGIILLQYTLMESRCAMSIVFLVFFCFFFFFAYCLLHAAFSPSRGMVKSQGHSDKGLNMQIRKVTMQHTNGGR